MRYIDLFSGIGGFALGLKQAGIEFEEWDLWTLNESGDCSGTEQEALFWRKVKEEEED